MEVKPGDLNIWFARYYSGRTDFTSYLILTAVFIIAAIYFKKKINEDTFWKVFLVSSIFWIIAELVLQGTQMRTWHELPTLFWTVEINYPITALVQGPLEGGIPTVLMYGFAKLFALKKDKIFMILTTLLIILVSLLFFSSTPVDATVSRRAVSIFSIILVVSFMVAGFFIAFKYYENIKYPLFSFLFMAAVGTFINIVGWLIGFRPILIASSFEIGQEASGWYNAPPGIAILMCLWDGVVEISGIYLGFYLITTYFWAKDDLSIKFRE